MTQAWHPDFVAHVERKYRHLLDGSRLSRPERESVGKLLLARESSADPDLDALETLAAFDAQLYERLHPSDYANYVRLRDSDDEQTELEEFAQGISQFAPLDGAQERALLDARLRRKEMYREATAANAPASSALRDYRAGFIDDVAPFLDREQLDLLRNYTATQFVSVGEERRE